MMKNFIWISLLLMISCGSRKVDVSKNSESQKSEIKAETKNDYETKSENTSETFYNISDDFLNFEIKPIGDQIAKFVFIQNGKRIEGETSGELNFGSQKRTEIGKITTKEVIHTTYKTQTNYQTKTTFKKGSKEKQSESKRSSFAWSVLAFVLGIVTMVLIFGFTPMQTIRNLIS